MRTPTWFSARRLFEQKVSELHRCTDLNQLNQVHAIIYKSNLHRDPIVATKLISAYSSCRQIGSLINVFNRIEQPDAHLYNALIQAHIRNSQPSQAFATYFQMQNDGVSTHHLTYPFLLRACSGLSWMITVTMIHGLIEKKGIYNDLFVPNSLVTAYSKCGKMGVRAAKTLFIAMEERDTVSWNCMMSGLVKSGELREAQELFDKMPERDTVSWNTILDGYAKAGEMDEAFKLFEKMPSRDSVSWSTMISGCCKVGNLEMARTLFDRMPVKNLVAWTIIISGYAAKGQAKEAMTLYDQIEATSLKLDDGTIVSILAACADSGMLALGERVHHFIERSRYNRSIRVFNSLIDMYAKCGSLNKALNIFNGMKRRDLVSWSTMIHGLGVHGYGELALQLFSEMKQAGFAPNRVTFIGILSACSHAGLIDEGIHYFYGMEKEFGVIPEIEHYGCMIDLLGRGGRLKEAFRLLKDMKIEPNDKIWGALLGACRKHNAVTLVEEEFKHLAQLGLTDSGNLSMLSNIFAAAGDWSNFAGARFRMKITGSKKPSGASSIQLDDEFHEFTVMDRSHPKSDLIYQMIDGLSQHLKKLGHVH